MVVNLAVSWIKFLLITDSPDHAKYQTDKITSLWSKVYIIQALLWCHRLQLLAKHVMLFVEVAGAYLTLVHLWYCVVLSKL